MAIAVVAHTIAGSADTNNVTSAGIDTTGSSLIVLFVSDFAGGSITPTDSKGNTWTARTLYQNTSDATSQFFYCVNPTVGAGHTFTVSSTGKVPSIAAIALSGTATSLPYDVENGNHATGSATTFQPGSITPGSNNEIVICGYSGYSGDVSSIDSGFTLLDHNVHTANHLTCGLAYIIQTAAGAVNPTWTLGASNVSTSAIASFKAAAAGAGVHPWWSYAGPMMGALGDTTSL